MDLKDIKNNAFEDIKNAKSQQELEVVFRKYLGRKGSVRDLLQALKTSSLEEKKEQGIKINEVKQEIEKKVKEKEKEFGGLGEKASKSRKNSSQNYGTKQEGAIHPLRLIEEEINRILQEMHFSVIDGPSLETEHYNFDALNIPDEHPSKDLWDTFWLRPKSAKYLLRTHTSPVQIRYMEQNQPPLQIIVPGTVFRYEATDASHHFQFHQVEGLMVSEDISIANFKFVINKFFSEFFNQKVTTRLRPGFFPFVEPGFEVDMQCILCGGEGCSSCGRTGWLEMAGAGMVHPNVFESAGYNPDKVTGFAFGMGLDRLAMMKFKINDVRLFLENDIRFLRQFS